MNLKPKTDTINLWCRAGILLHPTQEEADLILTAKDPSSIIRKILEEGRFTFSGEGYIPQGVVEASFAVKDGAVPEGCCDIDFYL